MSRERNPVQSFIRNAVRWGLAIPLWLLFARPDFQAAWAAEDFVRLGLGVLKTGVIFWAAHTTAGMFYVLPQWERLILLRLGKSVGARGPGFFAVPPFIYSVARIVDIRITTYEVKATKTLTRDNIPIDVTAAVELEVEDPEKAAIAVRDYWKTTEWASMEALKSTIGGNDLRPLLSETERVAAALKAEIDAAAKDYGVNVRAVRITDVGTPPTLVQELAVIARAERSAKAKQIQADAEKAVAAALAEATSTLAAQPGAMDLRQIQALLEISKEESAMVIVYPMAGPMSQQIAAAAAGAQAGKKKRLA
ncbi:MAG: SPFH domain-containing protein [Chloroflexota bacterium]|nr:SPFH domain-containing protein [Chloroflexota bacterium]